MANCGTREYHGLSRRKLGLGSNFAQALMAAAGDIALLNHFDVDFQTLFLNGVKHSPNIKLAERSDFLNFSSL